MKELKEIDVESELDRYGRSVKIELDSFYAQWKSALPYQRVLTKYSTSAKKLGLALTEFTQELENRGYLKVVMTPNNKRYVISSEHGLTHEDLADLLMSLEDSVK